MMYDSYPSAVSTQNGLPLGPGSKATSTAILSMQRIANFGSFLQAYCLRDLVNQVQPDGQVQFADFHPAEMANSTAQAPHTKMAYVKSAFRSGIRLTDTARFASHKALYSRRYLPLLGISGNNYAPAVDLQIIGSDEVFNCLQTTRSTGYVPELFGAGHRASKLVSYAASFGNTTYKGLVDSGLADKVAQALLEFDHLSVRDNHSQQLVERLTGLRPEVHVDPVLASPVTEVLLQRPSPSKGKRPYVISYAYPFRFSREENQSIRRFADSIGAKVVCIGGLQQECDKYINCSPLDVLGLFAGAAAVATDTFHGTIFAVLASKPFATLVRESSGGRYGNAEKLDHLLATLGLASRRADAESVTHILASEPDFSMARHRLSQERNRTASYLRTVLSNDA